MLNSKFSNTISRKLKLTKYRGAIGLLRFSLKAFSVIKQNIFKYIEYIIINSFQKLRRNACKHYDFVFAQPNGIGDALINSFYFDDLINNDPLINKKILLIASDIWEDLYKQFNYKTEILFINIDKFNNNFAYRLRILYSINHIYTDNFICNLKWKPVFFIKSLILYIKAGNYYISPDENGNCLNLNSLLYNNKLNINYISASEYKSEFIRIPKFYEDLPFAIRLSYPKRSVFNLEIKRNSSKDVIINFGGTDKTKHWDIKNYLIVADRIKDMGFNPILVGGRTEVYLKPFLAKTAHNFILNTLNLRDYSDLIGNSFAYIGSDTGPSHIAIWHNTPSIIILGGGAFGCYFPYPHDIMPQLNHIYFIHENFDCFNCNWQCKYDDSRFLNCLRSLRPSLVINTFNNIVLNSKTS